MNIAIEVTKNIEAVRSVIAQSTADSGRDLGSVELIGVSKQQPDERIEASIAAGLRVFGENRVQEAEIRWAQRRQQIPDLQLHLIGPLQTNKARAAVRLFDVIQTVDRPRIAATLGRVMEEEGRKIPCYVQINTGEEEQKAGIKPGVASDFVKTCVEECGLNIVGLMCIQIGRAHVWTPVTL